VSVTTDIRRIARALAVSRQAMRLGASQNPEELAAALELVMSVKPAVIVELGCDRGGTLYAWRQVCDRVYGITWGQNADSGGAECVTHGAEVLYGDSHDPDSLEWLRVRLAGDPVDVLVIDGDHHLDGVLADLADYSNLVRPGGLIMLHDVLPEQYPEVEVWKAWPQLREMYPGQTEVIGDVLGWGVIHV
jgi:cephalosporin hydroxylase